MNNTSRFYKVLNDIQVEISRNEYGMPRLFVIMRDLIDESEQQTIALESKLAELESIGPYMANSMIYDVSGMAIPKRFYWESEEEAFCNGFRKCAGIVANKLNSTTGVNAMQHNADEALGKQLDVYAKPADHNLIAIFNIRAEAEAETERKIEPYREAHAEVVAAENAKLQKPFAHRFNNSGLHDAN